MQIEFTPPNKQTHGYLRRQHKILEFKKILHQEPSAEMLEKLVEFFSEFVTIPEDKAAKIEALWDATQEQYENMLTALSGAAIDVEKENAEANPTPTPTS